MEDWMQLAAEEARQAAAEGEIPVGAVIVKDGHLLARAHNRRENEQDPTAHAEMLCLRAAARQLGSWRLEGCSLYVTLEPCPMCAGAMVMSRLSHCEYVTADTAYGCCGSVYDLPADPALQGHTTWALHEDNGEASSLLAEFFRGRRKSTGETP